MDPNSAKLRPTFCVIILNIRMPFSPQLKEAFERRISLSHQCSAQYLENLGLLHQPHAAAEVPEFYHVIAEWRKLQGCPQDRIERWV
jgi:hypothetical protein